MNTDDTLQEIKNLIEDVLDNRRIPDEIKDEFLSELEDLIKKMGRSF